MADHQKRGYQIRRLRRPVYPDREVVPQLQCTIDRFGATGDGAGCSILTFIRTGWYQDPSNRWHRLMVPSGPEQAIRTTVGPNHVASKESVLRLASACLTGQQERGNEEIEIDVIIGDIKSGAIPSGGKAQYEARCRLIEYILDKKIVEAPGCRNCPACLSETPLCFFDMPPLSWNFGVPRHVSACLRDNRRRH